MSSAVVSTSAALGRPFVFDTKEVPEVSLPSEPVEGRPPQRVRSPGELAASDPRLAHITPAWNLNACFGCAAERVHPRGTLRLRSGQATTPRNREIRNKGAPFLARLPRETWGFPRQRLLTLMLQNHEPLSTASSKSCALQI